MDIRACQIVRFCSSDVMVRYTCSVNPAVHLSSPIVMKWAMSRGEGGSMGCPTIYTFSRLLPIDRPQKYSQWAFYMVYSVSCSSEPNYSFVPHILHQYKPVSYFRFVQYSPWLYLLQTEPCCGLLSIN